MDMNRAIWNLVTMTTSRRLTSQCWKQHFIVPFKAGLDRTEVWMLIISPPPVRLHFHSDSSDSDSDSDSEMGIAPTTSLTLEQREKALIELDAMDDDEDAAPNTILRTANEILQLPEVKKPEVVLGPDAKLEPIGTVVSIVENVVVVQAASSGEVRVLDAGTVAAVVGPTEDGKEPEREVLGEVPLMRLEELDILVL